MKKINLFAALTTACIMFVSCGNSPKNEAEVSVTPVEGTEYAISSTTISGKTTFGIQKQGKQIVEDTFVEMSYNNGMFVGKSVDSLFGSDYVSNDLINPETGKTVINGDTIKYVDGYFEATSNNGGDPRYSLYFPETKKSFSALAAGYVLSDDILISKVYQGWGAITTANDTLLVPDNRKLVLLKTPKANYFLYQDEGRWAKVNAKKHEGTYLSSAELNRLKKLPGWSDTKDAFVITQK